MRTIQQQLSNYADYHRDPRNIATHFIGIPMIVVAVATLLSRPVLGMAGGVALTPALAVVIGAAVYYLMLDRRMGLLMTVLLALALAAGQWLAAQTTGMWLAAGIGLFVVGWVFQFVGHWWEGRKPAFVDDIMGLIIGPLFVAAEAIFALGLRHDLKAAVEAHAGPVRRRDLTPA